jgi:hypothetical protein
VHPVDPRAGQARERREVGLGGQPPGLEPPHLAGRGGGPAIDRLPQQAEELMLDVLSAAALGEPCCGHRGQANGVVELAVGEQATIGGDPDAVELELEAAVEGDPERWLLGFTRRVRHPAAIRSDLHR